MQAEATVNIAVSLESLGIGEGYAGSPGPQPAGIDTQDQLTPAVIVIVFFVKGSSDLQHLRIFPVGIQHANIIRQLFLYIETLAEGKDLVGEGHMQCFWEKQ